MNSSSRASAREVVKVFGSTRHEKEDWLALEEPLEIQVAHGPASARVIKTVAVTMRTPGHDRELAAGFLLGERLLTDFAQLESVHTAGPRFGPGRWTNSVRVAFRPEAQFNLSRLERNFYMTSSCGVCGKTSVEMLEVNLPPLDPPSALRFDPALICDLPNRLRHAQAVFERTGGLHAVGLFTAHGDPICVREDVGRHNAMDKVIGAQFLAGHPIPSDAIVVVSGRASFELMQKALAARISVFVSVGAPSSLAADLAQRSGATLIGFVKPDGFNIYTGAERIAARAPQPVAL